MASSRVVKMSSESEQEEWEDVQPLEGQTSHRNSCQEMNGRAGLSINDNSVRYI